MEPSTPEQSTVEMKEIGNVDVLQLQDSSSAELLSEMNSKHSKMRFLPFAGILSFVGLIILLALQIPTWGYAIYIPVIAVGLYLVHIEIKWQRLSSLADALRGTVAIQQSA